jgi:hypothetical protein
MGSLLIVRSAVLSLLEQARGDKYALTNMRCMAYADATHRNLKSALEAQVVITLPSDARGLGPVELLRREGKHERHLDTTSLNPRTAISKLFKDPLHCLRCDADGQGRCDSGFSGVGL